MTSTDTHTPDNKPDTSPSDAYLARVSYVVAYEAARLGRESGSITASLVGVIYTSRAWDVPKGDKLTLEAYVTAGGAEGTYRVARRMVGLLLKPKVSQEGHRSFVEACEAAHGADTPTEEMRAVTGAYMAYKGKQGWQAFGDALSGKVKVSKPTPNDMETIKAIEDAMSDGDDATSERAEQGGQATSGEIERAALGTVNEVEDKVLAYIRHCSIEQLEAVQAAVNQRMASEVADVKAA